MLETQNLYLEMHLYCLVYLKSCLTKYQNQNMEKLLIHFVKVGFLRVETILRKLKVRV